jgi:hypothetical protein
MTARRNFRIFASKHLSDEDFCNYSDRAECSLNVSAACRHDDERLASGVKIIPRSFSQNPGVAG